MARLRVGRAVRGDVGLQLRQRAGAHSREDGVTLRANCRERVWTGGRDADRRMWLLVGLGYNARVLVVKVVAVVREGLARPCRLEDLQGFGEPLATLGV